MNKLELGLGAAALSMVASCGGVMDSIETSIKRSIDHDITNCRNGFDTAVGSIFDNIDYNQLECIQHEASPEDQPQVQEIECSYPDNSLTIYSVADDNGIVKIISEFGNHVVPQQFMFGHDAVRDKDVYTYYNQSIVYPSYEGSNYAHEVLFRPNCNNTESGNTVTEILSARHAELARIAEEQNPSGE